MWKCLSVLLALSVVDHFDFFLQLQELRGNIRVFCRPRKDTRCGNCLTFPSEQDITVTSADGTKKTFSFDKVYTTEATQEEVR